MTSPLSWLEKWFKPLKLTVSARLRILRIFQGRLGELALGAFIAYNARLPEKTKYVFELADRIMEAWTLYIGLPVVLNALDKDLLVEPETLEFLKRYPLTQKYIEARTQEDWKPREMVRWNGYLESIVRLVGFVREIFELFMPHLRLQNYEQYKTYRLLEIKEQEKLDDWDFIERVRQIFDREAHRREIVYIPVLELITLNPFVRYEVKALTSYIYLFSVYRKITAGAEQDWRIRPVLRQQPVKVYTGEEFVGKVYLDNVGETTFIVPNLRYYGQLVTCDSLGLKFSYDVSQHRLHEIMTRPIPGRLPTPVERFKTLKVGTRPVRELITPVGVGIQTRITTEVKKK